MTTNIEKNKSFIRDFIAAMGRGDVAKMVDSYAEDGHWELIGHTLMSGRFARDALAAGAAQLFDSFPKGLHFEILTITAEDDRVAVEAMSRGTHVSGKSYAQHYHFLFQLCDGKIVLTKEFLDTEHATDVLCGGQRPPA